MTRSTADADLPHLPETSGNPQLDARPGLFGRLQCLSSKHQERLPLQVADTRNEELYNAEESPVSGVWVPLTLQLGLPLQPDVLCEAACRCTSSCFYLHVQISHSQPFQGHSLYKFPACLLHAQAPLPHCAPSLSCPV